MAIRAASSAVFLQPLRLAASAQARPAGLLTIGKLTTGASPGATNGDVDAVATFASRLARQRAFVEDIRRLVAAPPRIDATSSIGLAGGSFSTRPTFETRYRTFTTTGLVGGNASQVANVGVQGLARGNHLTIEGEVTRNRGAARLTVLGGSGATTPLGGTYELSGNLGSIQVAFTAGESFAAAAERINEHTEATGVTASIGGDNLVLQSTSLGASASVRLTPLEVEARTIEGVNSLQVDAVQIISLTPGASETLTGSLDSVAEAAELVVRGNPGGVAAGTATFRLSGTRGDATLAITRGESLTAVAERINQQTQATGVLARTIGDDLLLTSDTVGQAARVRVDAITPAYDTTVSGVNAAQVASFTVVSLDDGSEQVLSGEVLRTASAAELALQGAAGGTVIDTATFRLTGNLGTEEISIQAGESLSAVATRVNASSDSTGAVAEVIGNQLVFRSAELGSAAQIEIELVHVQHATSVSGVNAGQLTDFQVQQFTEGASQTLSGNVTQTAGKAELTFSGNFLSLVGTSATFTLSGSQGSRQFSVTGFQSLSNLASQVNSHTGNTGVTATVQGNQVNFRSVGVGSAATVGVQVTSGTFNVTGGNGNGTANGTNARAVINGQTITGEGNQFQFSDALGTYSFTTASGFVGAISPVSIQSLAGSFAVSGGNGDGTAAGLDALAEINGIQHTGVANRLLLDLDHGQFELDLAAGFIGAIDPITARSVPHAFEVDGGDAEGLAAGTDAVAIINGVELTSSDRTFLFAGEHGTYTIQFADGFSGPFDPITIQSSLDTLDIVGGDEQGIAYGNETEAILNGRHLVSEDGQFQFTEGGVAVTIGFQPGFIGRFDPIVAVSLTQTIAESVVVPGIGRQGSAPAAEGAAEPRDPYDLLLDEVAELSELAAEEAAAPGMSATRAQILSQQFAAIRLAAATASAESELRRALVSATAGPGLDLQA